MGVVFTAVKATRGLLHQFSDDEAVHKKENKKYLELNLYLYKITTITKTSDLMGLKHHKTVRRVNTEHTCQLSVHI